MKHKNPGFPNPRSLTDREEPLLWALGDPPSPRQQGRDGEKSHFVGAGSLVGSEDVREEFCIFLFFFFAVLLRNKRQGTAFQGRNSIPLPE